MQCNKKGIFCICFSSRLFGVAGVYREQPLQLGRREASARIEKIASRAVGRSREGALVNQSTFYKREYHTYIHTYNRDLIFESLEFYARGCVNTANFARYLLPRLFVVTSVR